jgi:hypothetical protein
VRAAPSHGQFAISSGRTARRPLPDAFGVLVGNRGLALVDAFGRTGDRSGIGIMADGQRLQLSPGQAQEPLRRAVSPEAPTFRSMTSWFALAISAAALVVTVLSCRRDRKASREATTSADRAAARADEAVEAQKRMAEALEAQLAPPAAAWCLEHFQGDSYLLTNTGTASAYHVHLDLGDISIVRGELDSALLRAGDAHKFMAARTMGTVNDTVTVSWRDSPTSSQGRQWARPLPPRPPR